MLSEEVKRYRELSGDNRENVSIARIGGYLDGYEKAMEKMDKYRWHHRPADGWTRETLPKINERHILVYTNEEKKVIKTYSYKDLPLFAKRILVKGWCMSYAYCKNRCPIFAICKRVPNFSIMSDEDANLCIDRIPDFQKGYSLAHEDDKTVYEKLTGTPFEEVSE